LPTPARNFYVAPNGNANNDGSRERPLDLATALSDRSPARAGDAIWLRGGTYSTPISRLSGTDAPPFVSALTGTANAPIQVRQFPGERATIDGGIRIEGGYTYYIDFEVTNSNPDRTKVRPTGLNVYGHHVKIINVIVHDAGDGIGFWQLAEDSEIYGAILYRNGWEDAGDFRGNGHGIYAQNLNGTKRIVDVISFDNYATGMKAFTEQGYVRGVHFEGNISFNNGSAARPRPENDRLNNLFVGAGINPSERITLVSNYTYHPLTSRGPSIQLGYTAARNGDAVLRDNYFAGGTTTLGYFTRWDNIVMSGNTLIGDLSNGELLVVEMPAGRTAASYQWDNNNYFSASNAHPFGYKAGSIGKNYSFQEWQQATGQDRNSRLLTPNGNRPSGVKVFVRPNLYAAGRANIAIYNWDLKAQVEVDISRFARAGGKYEIRDAQNFFGQPVISGTFDGRPVLLPMNGAKTGPEFNAFVLIADSAAAPSPSPNPGPSPDPTPASTPAPLPFPNDSADPIPLDAEEQKRLDLINDRLSEPSLIENLVGNWKAQSTISSQGVAHADPDGWGRAGYAVEFQINPGGLWMMRDYRSLQTPAPAESGVWIASHDASRNEEIVTFIRQNGSPPATIRIHAARGQLTFFAVDGGGSMKNFLRGVAADDNRADDPQIIFLPRDVP
jgi:hypothetical protein